MSYEAVAEQLAASKGVRILGGATKATWGRPVRAAAELRTSRLGRIVDHQPGDFTAVLQAGVRLADAQAEFARHGQMLALDPPGEGATIGGIVATRDSGPLRHRYGTARDLVIGIAVALPDGSVARAGGRVIKNVAGYDLAKLACGAFGTLGVIVEVCVRLHPLPPRTATAVFRHDDPAQVAAAYLDAFARPLELEALDVRWVDGEGAVLARFAGAAAPSRAAALGWPLADDEEAVWAAQRAAQRSADGVVVRISALPSDTERVLTAARDQGATVVGRAGTFYCTLHNDDKRGLTPLSPLETRISQFAGQRGQTPLSCLVMDAPMGVRAARDPWGIPEGPELGLMRRVRERFDPRGVCNPGIGPA